MLAMPATTVRAYQGLANRYMLMRRIMLMWMSLQTATPVPKWKPNKNLLLEKRTGF